MKKGFLTVLLILTIITNLVTPVFASISVSGVTLNKTNTSINIGSSEILVASVSPVDATNQEVTWSSDNTAVATVSSGGEVIGISAGNASITVTTTDGGYTASCTVEVTAANIAVSGVTLNKTNTSINIGSSEILVASVSPVDATNQEVTWSSDNTAVATVSNSGEVTGISAGNASITVTTTDGGYTASCIVEVTAANIAVTGVSLNKTSTSIAIGANETLVASVSPVDATNQEVTWSSDNTAVATVSSGGEVIGISVGTASITATTVDGGYTASCTVEVTAANIAVTGVSLNKTSTSIAIGANETLVASVSPVDATNQEVTWSSDNTAVATVSSGGEVIGISVGTASITATTVDGGYTATCIVETISQQIPTNIVTTSTYTTVDISWDGVSGATGYDIEADGIIIDRGSETTYKHGGLDTESGHTYRVRAKNESGVGLWSDYINATTLSPITAQITVDGNDTEWANILTVALGEDDTIDLSAVQDSNKLYMLIRGTNIGDENKFYIDSDNDSATGNHNTNWLECGADFLIDDGGLWHWVNDNWEYVGEAVIARNSTIIEVAVEFNQIGRTGPGEMRLSYDRYDANCAPAAGNITAMIDMMITEVDEEIIFDGSVYNDAAKYYQYCLKALGYTDSNNNPIIPNGYFGELSYSALNKFLEDYQFTYFNTQASEKLMEEAENLAAVAIQSGFENNLSNHKPVVFMYSDIANIDNLNDPFYSMQVLKGYPYLVTSKPSSLSYTSKRVADVIKADTKLFGYINLGPNNPCEDRSLWQMADLDELKAQIDQISIAGWYGVFIDQFGYDFSETRARQNEVVDYAHSKGLKCFVNAWFPEDAMSSEVREIANPEGIPPHLNAEDWYLIESFFTSSYCSRSNSYYLDKYLRAKQLHDTTGVNISVLTYGREDLTEEGKAEYINMSYILSQCLGYEGWWYIDGASNINLIQGNDIEINIGSTLVQELHYEIENKYIAETDQYLIEYYASDNPGILLIPVSGLGETIIIGNIETIPVTGISLNKTNITINEGNSVALAATIEPENASDMSYSWMSDNTAVATVNSNGNVTGVSEGTANIIVTTTDGGHTATCEVTVIEGYGIVVDGNDVDWISISPIAIGTGAISNLSAIEDENKLYVLVRGTGLNIIYNLYIDNDRDNTTGYHVWLNSGADYMVQNGTLFQYTGTGYDWSWSNVGTINLIRTDTIVELSVELEQIGLTEKNNIKIGFSNTLGKAPAIDNEMASVIVIPIAVSGISLNKTNTNLLTGASETLEAILEPVDASNKEIIWTSDSEAVATVDANGVVTGISEGTATITVTTVDGGFTATCEVEVFMPLSAVSQVTGGDNYTVVLKDDGTVWSWGKNNNGALGDGTTTHRNTPVQTNISDVTKIIAGEHTLAIKGDRTVWAWGYNYYGEVGDGTTTNRSTPVQVNGISNVIEVAAGNYHSIALKSDGTVWTWGCNNYGQLGDGTTTNRSTPGQISSLSSVTAIAGGRYHSIALKEDGTVWTWGHNEHGQLGDGTTTNSTIPLQVSGLSDIIAIAVGEYHSIALKNDGTVWTWGYNNYGQLGNGTTINSTTPIQVNGLSGVTKIEGGSRHTAVLKNDGTLWIWGRNGYGQLGDGTLSSKYIPQQVNGISDITAMEAGGNHTIALKSNGAIWTWGYNYYGQIGDGTNEDRNIPTHVFNLENIAVSGVSLNKTSTDLLIGASETLEAILEPVDASNKEIIWTSDSEAVATVDANGVVTGISEGTATITVTTVDGGFTASCEVTVTV